ncbi:hypothetical protein MW674_004801 [Klebsiella oxytoca]|nr:hypothetical protein [Klebsiella oxytoca]
MKIATDFTGDNIWSLHRERDNLNREIKSCEPSRRKKMRYLSHFRLFITAGFIGRNRQAGRRTAHSGNLMILKKIKK